MGVGVLAEYGRALIRDLITERSRRGVFASMPELVAAINDYVAHQNIEPKPFIWTGSARGVLQKVNRANRACIYVRHCAPRTCATGRAPLADCGGWSLAAADGSAARP